MEVFLRLISLKPAWREGKRQDLTPSTVLTTSTVSSTVCMRIKSWSVPVFHDQPPFHGYRANNQYQKHNAKGIKDPKRGGKNGG